MPEIEIKLKEGSYKSFSGVQFTDNYLKKSILIYDYVTSIRNNTITSKSIQNHMRSKYGAQDSDIRTLISLFKKFGFVNDFDKNTTGDNLFTKEGELFVHVANIKMNMSNLPIPFQSKINDAFSLILQKGFIYAQVNRASLDIPSNFWLLVGLLKKLGKLSGKEYLYAIWCSDIKTIDEIASMIINNRRNRVDYDIKKDPDDSPVANTSYSYNFGLLVQAGIVDYIGDNYYKLTNDIFQ